MATKRRKIFIGMTGVALSVFVVVAFWPEKDPIYKEHHLSEWVAGLIYRADSEKDFDPPVAEIREAVLVTSSNNIPLLVHWIRIDTDNTALNRMFKVDATLV